MAEVLDQDMEPLIRALDDYDFDVSNDDDGTDYQFRINGVKITYQDLKNEYKKVHKKIPANQKDSELSTKGSWMRVKGGEVNIGVEINIEGCSDRMFIAKVVVQRERRACAEARQMNDGPRKYVAGEVSIAYKPNRVSETRWVLSLDLDSVYYAREENDLKEVYALCPSNIEVTNKFQLVTELFMRSKDEFGNEVDRLVGRKESQPFLMRTEPRPNKQGVAESPGSSHAQSPRDERPPENEDEAPNATFDNLVARNALIGTLSANKIQTANRDIGYHIPLKDLSQKGQLDEGDVVGFFEDNQKSAIERIDKENYDRAKLAGVITRSYYVEGMCPEAQLGHSDLVCVLGIVKVRVVGIVRTGDLLYAYKKVPGVAATSARLRLDRREENGKPFLIGQALESKTDVEHDQEKLISAFVSLVNGIDSLAMHHQVERLDENFTGLIRNLVYDATKKIKQRFFWLKLLLIVVLVTIGIALWQRYAPNTLLRASLCKRGNYEERVMTLSFNTSWQEIKITALEFKYHKLKQKIYKASLLKIRPGNNIRYFINYERCKNRGVSYGNEYLDDTPTVSGPELLSSDQDCNPHSIKYFNNNKWIQLMTAKRSIKITDCNAHL